MGSILRHTSSGTYSVGIFTNLIDTLSARRPAQPQTAAPAPIENALTSDSDWDAFLTSTSGGRKGVSGVRVSHETLLRLGPVSQAIQTISGDIACSTLQLHSNMAEPGEESVQSGHFANNITAIRWDRFQSAFECWKRIAVHALIWGNGYAYISRDSRGRIQWMANLCPGSCYPSVQEASDGSSLPGYLIHFDGMDEPFFAGQRDVYHLRGSISIESDCAEDALTHLRDTVSVQLGAQKFQGAFFANGAQAGGIISVPVGVPFAARERLEEQIQKKSNAENWFRTMVLRDGAQWHQTTVDSKSGEMIAVQDAATRDIARFFKLPPFKLGLLDSASYNSSEIAEQVYLKSCLNHWLKAIACEAHLKMLPDSEQVSGNYRFEHNVSKLLEPDFQTLNTVLGQQRTLGIINANDYRKKINLPLRSDEEAFSYANPNTTSSVPQDDPKAEEGTEYTEDPEDTEDTEDTEEQGNTRNIRRLQITERKLLQQAVDRAVKRVCTPLCNRAKKPDNLLAWLNTEASEHRNIVQSELETVLELIVPDDVENTLKAIESVFFGELLSAVRVYTEPPYSESNLLANITQVCDQFDQQIFSHLEDRIFHAIV